MKSAMTSSPLRVAIIGAGQVADKVHASYYCTRNDLELVAVCDSRLSQAQALADKYGNASVWDDPQAMLLAVKPDVVSVCSPNRFHYEHTLMALEAGCHVMCEKPPAMTPEQAREMCDTARKLGKVLAYDFHHRFALDTQQLREQVTNGVLGEIYVTTARALRRCGVPGWGVFTNKELQGGGPLIDIGIHMLDAAMYVLGFPAVKSVNAHSFQKIGTQKSCGQFGEWDPATYSVEDSLFGTIEFHNGGILWLETSFALNIREQSIMNVSFCGDKAGATLFPAHIYTDNNGELMTLMQREMADDNRHLRSMEAFINHVQGKPVMIADAEQGYIIQQLVAALYQSAETGTHDQTEAMTMATRIVIMKDGIVQQVGAPKTVYNQPANMFVAGFIGSPAMNFIRGTIDGDKFVTETLKLTIPEEKLAVLKTQGSLHKPIVMGIRPEDIHPDAQEENNISAKISVAELTGAEFMLYTTVGGHELVVRAGALNDYHAGENITIHFDMTKCHFFDAETEIAIR